MTTVAIIAEYNPAHLGHAYLVSRIRKNFGPNTRIVAIMSGNYMQRGDISICDAYTRGRMALTLGVDLVVELPFPYSMSSAEKYATAGVRLAQKLGCVDYLAFGSESGDLDLLEQVARFTFTETYEVAARDFYQDEANKMLSFANLRAKLISEHIQEIDENFLKNPNNILAIEYIRAIIKERANIKPWTIKRIGSYHETTTEENGFASASKIRGLILEQNIEEALMQVPKEEREILRNAVLSGLCPSTTASIENHLLLSLREKIKATSTPTAEMDESLRERFAQVLFESASFNEFLIQVKAKHYTDAHIRRAVWFAYFGITSTDLDESPSYTRVLAANEVGCALLKDIKRIGQIPVLTKTADYRARLDGVALRQAELAFYADSVYNLCIVKPQSAAEVFKKTPFIEK